MATPEQNTALGIGLFQPATRVITDANDQRVALLTHLAQIADQQRFQREELAQQQRFAGQQATQAQGAAVNLENLRNTNQQVTNDKALDRQLQVGRQAQDARDLADLNRQFALSYPIYAHAAAVLGKTPAKLSSYEQTWEGLGQLQGDMADLKEQADKGEKSAAAQGVVAILDQSTQQLADAIKARDDGIKLTAADHEQAKSMGLAALQRAAVTGAIPGLDPKDKKFASALAALSKDQPDVEVATRLLGPAGIQAYSSGVQQGLLALANDKERLAKIAALNRDVQAAQRGSAESLTRLMTLASTNPELGTMLKDRATTLSSLTKQAGAEPAQPDTNSVFKSLIGNPTSPGPNPAAPPPPPAAPTGAGSFGSAMLGPLASLFGSGSASAPPAPPGTFRGPGGGAWGYAMAGPGVAPPAGVTPTPTPTPTLTALAPQPPPPPTQGMPAEVSQAAAIIANNPNSPALEPYRSALRAWLDNNGIGRPYSEENVNLRRLVGSGQLQPAY